MFIVIACVPVCDITNFKKYLRIIMQQFSYINEKVGQKGKNILRIKRAIKMK